MKRKLTDEQEKEIRNRFFYKHHDWRIIAADFGISEPTMRKIVGGPLTSNRKPIERIWT